MNTRHVWGGAALVLWVIAAGTGIGRAAVTAAPGWAVRTIPTPDVVQGAVVRRGDDIFVGQGPTFTGGAETVIRFSEGGSATTVATGFNALGGFDLSADGTLYLVDNGLEAAGATSGDTLYAVPEAITRTAALPAASAEVLPSESIAAAFDVLVVPGGVLVSDAAGPGKGRVVQVVGSDPIDLITGLDFTAGLALNGSTLLVGNVSFVGTIPKGSIRKYDLAGVPAGILVDGLSGNYSHVVDGAGDVLVTGGVADDFSSTVVAVDPLGTVTERARGFAFSGELFFDAVRDETLVLDFGVSEITAICRDADQDGTCDADEPCESPVGKAKLRVKKLGIRDETLSLKGEITLPVPPGPSLDPVTRGVRVRLETVSGGGTNVTVPPGARDPDSKTGWKANKALTSWTYTSKTGIGSLAITEVTVKTSRKKPGVVKIGVRGKGAALGLTPADLPLAATVKLDPSGQCGTATFTGPDAACKFNKKQTEVTCK
jgi:hypothetical protein